MSIQSLLKNVRFFVLLTSIALSLAEYIWASTTIPDGSLQIIRLTQLYALTALTYLYLVLLAGPFCYTFRWFPWRGKYLKARRAIGVSAFFFAFLHARLAFYEQLGGFPGLGFLPGKYLLAISLSFTALVILTLMAATSFDFMVAKLTFPKWKFLHRFVYLAGVLILIHAVMLGTHFQDLSSLIPQVLFIALAFLLFLEALRVDSFLKRKFPQLIQASIISILLFMLLILAILYFLLSLPSTGNASFGIPDMRSLNS